jgi:hypothetical protein
MDTVINVFIYDKNGELLPNAEVHWRVNYHNKVITLGPVTSIGLHNKPVVVQLSGESTLDDPFIDIIVIPR